jgi:hypothetical protein
VRCIGCIHAQADRSLFASPNSPKKAINNIDMGLLSVARIVSPVPILVLIASFLLGSCAPTGSGKSGDPVIFGSAGGGNNGGAATSGMSLSW